MASKRALSSELKKTMSELDELNSADVTLNDTSVRHCGLMVKYWSIKLQMAEIESESKDNILRRRAGHMIVTASKHLCEWERRKAAAWEKRRLDELPKLAAKIEEFRKAGSLLADLH